MWNWKNFKKEEIACKGVSCGCNKELWNREKYGDEMPDYFVKAMEMLQEMRENLNMPIIITSAHRCVKHNVAVGGAKKSRHLDIAFDIKCTDDIHRAKLMHFATKAGFTSFGVGKTFLHIDSRTKPTFWRY